MAVRTLHVDSEPMRVRDVSVERVHMFDVPAGLRAHAASIIDGLPVGEWHTLGAFMDDGETLHDTAVVRRVMRDGRLVMEYGIEC